MRNHVVLLAALGVAAITAVVAIPLGAQGSKPSSSKDVVAADASKANFNNRYVQTRGQARTQWFSANMNVAEDKIYTFTESSAMDVTSVTFFSDIAPATTNVTGTIYLEWAGGIPGFPINFASAGPGTIHLQFETPVSIRAGDMLRVSQTTKTGTPTRAIWEISFHGTVPAVAKTNAAVAY